MIYISGNLRIAESNSHEGMWIITYPDGDFININCSKEYITSHYHVDKLIKNR